MKTITDICVQKQKHEKLQNISPSNILSGTHPTAEKMNVMVNVTLWSGLDFL
jgi:hypothetical protein